ncbi:uncharacterized protein isoform X2 [Rhodnius prolixus]|uniref:uncharacterized protein isoform X2 n=1 Tax=Rhodnius prolixus TaxID=13249 RepID=UPI003D18BC17
MEAQPSCGKKVYEEILRQFEVLMNEYLDCNEKLWCHLIGYRSYVTIVLEDLKVKNFVVADRKKMLDLNHSKLVLHSLGRFHALGYILIQKGLLQKEDLPPFYCEEGPIIIERMYKGGLMILSNVIEKYWTPEWKEIGDRLFKEQNIVMEKLKKLFEPRENDFITLCHGDCWTCNMMFKYSPFEENYPISFKFLDFQTAHVSVYIFDVMHFLYTSVQPEVRRAYYEKLLSMYHKSLQTTLALYGFEDRTPTLKNIHSEAERIEYYGFITSLIVLPATSADVKDAFKLEYLNNDSKWTEAFNEDIFKSDLYKSAVQPELRKWFNKGLF